MSPDRDAVPPAHVGRSARRERLIRFVTAVSLAFSTVYIVWRWGWTLNTEALWFSAPLALAETYGLLTAFFMAVTAWRLGTRPPARPLPGRSVDVFVTTYDEPLAIIRKTALAARAIRYPHATYILDDGRREDVRRLAADLGIEYLARATNEHAKAGNLNHALLHTSGEFVLQLDADHMPLPQIVDRLLGHFRDERVAFVQSPQDFYNTDAFTYDVDVPGRRLWEDQQLFFRVLQPGKDRLGATFFVGSCAMLRRSAITSIGGFATRTITEDIETSLLLHAQGWKSVYVKESLAFGLAPSTALAFHVQHLRWGQGAMQTLRHYGPLRLKGLSLAQRIGYFDSLTTYLGGFQRLILYLAPLVFFVTGVFPMNVSATAFALMFVPYLALQLASFKLLARGHGSLLLADRFAMAKFFTHLLAVTGYLTRRQLRFRVTPKEAGHVGLRFYAPQLILAAATFAILAFAVWERVVGLAPDEVPGWGAAAFWVNAAYALWNASVAASIVRVSRGGQHRRLEHRFTDALAVNLRIMRPDGRLARYDVGITENLNPQGAALRSMHAIDPGARIEMTLPLSSGEVTVRGRLVRRLETSTPYGTVHVHGVEFAGLDDDTRNAIELHCAQHATPLERQRYQVGTAAEPAQFRWRNFRRVTRVAVGLPVRVSAESATSAKAIGMGLLENISPAGARMLLDHPVAAGSTLHLEVPGTTYSSRGRVVFVESLESSVGMRFVVGMSMDEGSMTAPSENWIDAVLATAARSRDAIRRAQVPVASAGRYVLARLAPAARDAERDVTPTAKPRDAAMRDGTPSGKPAVIAAARGRPFSAVVQASDVVGTSAIEAGAGIEPVQAVEPAQPVEPVQPVQSVEAVPAVESAGRVESVQAVETTGPVESAETVQAIEVEEASEVESHVPTATTGALMQTAAANTLLTIRGSNARLEGRFEIEESIEVQCELTGELVVGDTLVIGQSGRVSADVKTVNAIIHGTYSGNLTASGSVEIASTGRASGTLESNELVIAKGAVFTGSVSRTEAPPAQKATKPAAQPAAQQGAARSAASVPAAAQPADVAVGDDAPLVAPLADVEPARGPRLQSVTLS